MVSNQSNSIELDWILRPSQIGLDSGSSRIYWFQTDAHLHVLTQHYKMERKKKWRGNLWHTIHIKPLSSSEIRLDKIDTKCITIEKSKGWPSCSTTSATWNTKVFFFYQKQELYWFNQKGKEKTVHLQWTSSPPQINTIIPNRNTKQQPIRGIYRCCLLIPRLQKTINSF